MASGIQILETVPISIVLGPPEQKLRSKKNFKSVGTRFLSQTLLSAATQPCTDFLNDIHYAMTLNTMLSGRRWYTVMSQWFRIIFEGVIPNQVAKGQN